MPLSQRTKARKVSKANHVPQRSNGVGKPSNVHPLPTPKAPKPITPYECSVIQIVKAITTEDKKNPGKNKYIRFMIPIVRMGVRAEHWPSDQQFIFTHHRKGWGITFPNGEKKSVGESLGCAYILSRFGASTLKTLQTLALGM